MAVQSGQTFNSWTVVKEVDKDKHGNRRVLVKCKCGAEHVRVLNTIRYGHSRHCRRCSFLARGGVNPGTHGKSHTPEYKIWGAMKERCGDPHNKRYERYGGRGIGITSRWLGKDGFPNFLKDMGPRPSRRHSIDRIDNNEDYSPENCRWATAKEQQRNRSSNRFLTVNGVRKTLVEWSEETGINYGTLKSRIYRGWSPEDAVRED